MCPSEGSPKIPSQGFNANLGGDFRHPAPDDNRLVGPFLFFVYGF
jgi:hypothetical protein